tara:strand:+ start:288 stop:557 length:270 start_codon:yes stop_codon:yes gene_type:complete
LEQQDLDLVQMQLVGLLEVVEEDHLTQVVLVDLVEDILPLKVLMLVVVMVVHLHHLQQLMLSVNQHLPLLAAVVEEEDVQVMAVTVVQV